VGTVIWVFSLLTKVTVKGSVVSVFRVTVPWIVLPSVICSLLILTVKVGLKSLSIILTIALFCVPIVAPLVGLERLKLMVSVLSKILSSMRGMLTFLLISPSAKLTVIWLLL
jgi:hypothetical protein